MDRVISLDTIRVEIPQLADVAVRSVGEEVQLLLDVRTQRVVETALPVKKTEEQLRRAAGIGGGSPTRILRPGELVAPAKIHETVHIPLVVVLLGVACRIEWDLELGLREVRVEIDDVVETWRELDLSESVPVLSVIVKILDLVGCRIEDHRLASHVRRLVRAREEVTQLACVRAGAQALTVRVVIAGKPRELIMQSARRNPGRDVDHRRVLVSILRIPAASYEINLVDHGRLEELIEAA